MITFIFIYGLLIGSFLNVCIYRIPREESIVFPGSHCPNCTRSLKPLDLIPSFSYLSTGGKCRYCKVRISFRYPFFEFLTAFIFLLIYYCFGLSLDYFVYCFLTSLLIVIAGIDFDYQIIPDGILLLGAGACLLNLLYSYLIRNHSISFLDNFGGAAIGGGLFLLIAAVSRGGMGGGDIKLMAMLGLWLGIKGILITTLLSFIIGAVVSLILLAFKLKTRKEAIAFGPFIAIAALIVICFQDELLIWYLEKFIR